MPPQIASPIVVWWEDEITVDSFQVRPMGAGSPVTKIDDFVGIGS